MTIEDIRKEIDSLDDRIYDLLMERAALALKIGEEKRRNNTQIVQPDRENIVIRRLLARHKGALPPEAIERIWREIMKSMLSLQTD